MNRTDIYRLVYVSHRAVDCTEQDVAQILDTARRLNQKDEIVGALMVSDRRFAQVLEGSHDKVQDTFERIGMDHRHVDPLVLSFERVAAPSFEGWSMARVAVDDATIAADELLRTAGAGAGAGEASRLAAFARNLVLSHDIVRAI